MCTARAHKWDKTLPIRRHLLKVLLHVLLTYSKDMVEDAEGDGLYLALIIDFAGTEDQVVVHFQTRFQHFTDNLGDIHRAKKAKRIFWGVKVILFYKTPLIII